MIVVDVSGMMIRTIGIVVVEIVNSVEDMINEIV